ncbi:hypothetical protein [Streptomyces niger]|uniref:hypothetical protein n=1 Tax=Streptomyces niger TaxID=66373 RepID=UPI00069CB7CF|nr:hypothetical protein [Streptomyces niger]
MAHARSAGRTSATVLCAAVAISGALLATAPAASAASYHCKTSHATIDDASYTGPAPDNWDVTVRNCAKRSGSSLYSYARISWDGPVYGQVDDSSLFDGAYYRLMVKKSRSGTDPMVKSHKLPGIEQQLENSAYSGNYNGSYRTPTYKTTIGKYALTDGTLYLDWNNDGHGYRGTAFAASPRV